MPLFVSIAEAQDSLAGPGITSSALGVRSLVGEESVVKGIEVRWAGPEDTGTVARIIWRSGGSIAFSGDPASKRDWFLVAEERGEVLAVARCRRARGGLVLDRVAVDPRVEALRFAPALYAGAGELARDAGMPLVWVESDAHREYLLEAGYARRVGGWRLDTDLSYIGPGALPKWCRRGLLAFWRATDGPTFRASWF